MAKTLTFFRLPKRGTKRVRARERVRERGGEGTMLMTNQRQKLVLGGCEISD